MKGKGHRVGYQYGMLGDLYAENIEFGRLCVTSFCSAYLYAEEDRDTKDLNMLQGKMWLYKCVLILALLWPEAGIVTWEAKKDFTKGGKEIPNKATVTLTEKENEQIWAEAMFNDEGWMTEITWREFGTIFMPGKQRPMYQIMDLAPHFSEYREQERGMWVPMRMELGMVPGHTFSGRHADKDSFLVEYRAKRITIEYEFDD